MIKLELLGGARGQGEFERLKSRLEALHQLSVDYNTWLKAAEISFNLRRKGVTIPSTDILIAAVVIRNESFILHVDSHFDRIATHVDLLVESYAEVASP